VVADEVFMRGDVHFKAQLTKIREKKPEVLFVPGTYAEVGLILRQARELGLNATLLGGDGWDSPRLVEVAGAAADGSHFSTHFASDADAPLVKHFVQEFTSTFGYDPDGFAAMGYESGRLLIDALGRASTLDPAGVQKALSETKKVEGLSGEIVMGADREPQKPAFIMKVAQGKFKYETRIWPR
jgi:branched-chain amino acid transport system substrate-binding protein